MMSTYSDAYKMVCAGDNFTVQQLLSAIYSYAYFGFSDKMSSNAMYLRASNLEFGLNTFSA